MELYNRRQVLTGISAGLAVAGVAATLPAGSASAAAAALVKDNGAKDNAIKDNAVKDNASSASLDGPAGPVVAYIHDASSGEISLFVGSREVTLHDSGIAAKLASVANKGA